MGPGEVGVAEAGGEGPEEEALRAVSLPLAEMPGGTRIGSLIHAVFEGVDFTARDLGAEMTSALDDELAWSHIDVGPTDAVVAGLVNAVETPLGPLAGDVRLRDIGRADRLDELGFELPLVGGDSPAGDLTLAAIATLLDAYVGPDDVLAGYADRLREPGLTHHLRGFLTGSIDAVLRLRTAGGPSRFVVVDYKTNWLSGDEVPSAWDYRPRALATAMQRAHYPLQALLYAVALHRFLRWRLPSYEPDLNLAGVLYLFLRGMTGTEVPRVAGQPCGVFAWRPPAGLVAALSDLFDRGEMPA
jgi:exodeoxyribonuclease V beta subunit